MAENYTYVWEFTVPESARAEFEAHYAPTGSWATMFKQHAGYIDTLLLHDVERPERYVTIDRWASRQAYESFRKTSAEAYASLDRQCENLTSQEKLLGVLVEPST